MLMEVGVFGEFQSDGVPAGIFAARIVIPPSEFARLGLGDHERPGAMPACFRWCHAEFGAGGTRWYLRLPPDRAGLIYFADRDDAAAFFVRWAVAHSDDQFEPLSALPGEAAQDCAIPA